MHRASPTLLIAGSLIAATCLAGSLLTAAPAAADDDATPPPVLLTPSPTATDPGASPTAAPTDEAAPEAPPTFSLDEPSPLDNGSAAPFASPSRAGDTLVSTNVVMAATADVPAASSSITPPRTRLPLRKGHYGSKVTLLQERLAWLGYPTPESVRERGAFGKVTKSAVKAFQVKNWLPATGVVNQRTWTLLKKQASPIGLLPDECIDVKASLCIDKTAKVLRWVVKGQVKLTTDARFGAPGMETDEGVFAVKEKSFNHTSSKYHTWMPRAMFFNGDEAVHYSPDFAAYGYAHGSHGCVGVRDMEVATTLFAKVPVGTRVVVYWS